MKNHRILSSFLLAFAFCTMGYGQAPAFAWAHVFSAQEINAVATNPLTGDIYAAGHFANTVDFDPGPSTFNLTGGGTFLGKYDAAGDLIWALKQGGSNVQEMVFSHYDNSLYLEGNYQGIKDFDPDTGVFNLDADIDGNVFFSKINGDGVFAWVKAFKKLTIGAIKIDPGNGDIYLTGSFAHSADADPGTNNHPLHSNGYGDIFVIKLDSDGNFQWVKTLGGTYIDTGTCIDIDPTNGDIFVAGLFTSTVDFNPDPVDEFYMSGPSQWGYAFILKLDASGNFKWAKSFGGTGSFINPSLQLGFGEKKNIFFAASAHGSVEVNPDPDEEHPLSAIGWAGFILELDSVGNLNWVKVIKSDYEVFINSMVIDLREDRGIYVGGDFGGTADLDPGPNTFNLVSTAGSSSEIYIAHYDLSGNFIWAKSAGGTKHDYGESIALDSSGNVYVGGYFTSDTIMFDNTKFVNSILGGQFSYDMFLAKLGTSLVSVPVELNPGHIRLYPNPASDELAIEIDSIELGRATIRFFDYYGKIVFAPVNISGIHRASIDVSNLIPGIYFIRIQIDNKISVKKFVKI